MTVRRGAPVIRPRGLSWAPPTLTSPTTVNVSADASARYVTLDRTKDYVVRLPSVPVRGASLPRNAQCLVTIDGGRNVVVIGGQISPSPAAPPKQLIAPYTDGDTTLQLSDVVGLEAFGCVQGCGYGWSYSGITGNTLTGVVRNTFVYGNAISLPLAAGETIWQGEPHRGGIAFVNTAGTAHLEGVLIDGDLIDGVRFVSNAAGTVLQMQNCRVGPNHQLDRVTRWDGHPDALQMVIGPATCRLDRLTLFSEGQGILNQNDGIPGVNCALVQARDVVVVGGQGQTSSNILWSSTTPGTIWDTYNCWARKENSQARANAGLVERIQEPHRDLDFCPPGVAGIGYVSPGYLS